jgi:hypothetical protein
VDWPKDCAPPVAKAPALATLAEQPAAQEPNEVVEACTMFKAKSNVWLSGWPPASQK